MKRNDHCIIPEGRFRLLQGEDMLTLYQFNTKVAKHVFCRCGNATQVAPQSDAVLAELTTAVRLQGVRRPELLHTAKQSRRACNHRGLH